jgi:hypothetical protein
VLAAICGAHVMNCAMRDQMRHLTKEDLERALTQLEAIIDTDWTAIQKLTLLKVRLRCDHRTLAGAYPSYSTLMRAASAKDDRSVRAALDKLVKDKLITQEWRGDTGRSHDHRTRQVPRGARAHPPIFALVSAGAETRPPARAAQKRANASLLDTQ